MNVAERLAKLDACTVSDAMDAVGLAPAVSDLPRRSTDRTISGQVITVRLGSTRPQNASLVHLGATAIDQSGPGKVIVVEQRTGIDAGAWGGILSNAAKLRKCEGVVIEGACRDIDEARELGFPVFARRTTARTARGRVYEQETGGALTIGDTQVENGDWVIADDSGIVFVPAARIEEVLDTAERIAEREKLILAGLAAGKSAAEIMGANYENMLSEKKQ